jgi:hypothetical protein
VNQSSIALFQRAHGLQVDGIVGPATTAIIEAHRDILNNTPLPVIADPAPLPVQSPAPPTVALPVDVPQFPMKAFDIYAGTQSADELDRFYVDGYRCGIHYYSNTPGKNLTHLSAVGMTAKGFQVASVWEAAGATADGFSSDMGQHDGASAVRQAIAVGQPKGSGIAFAVDFDPSPNEITQYILPYFAAVRIACGAAGFLVGAYACGRVLLALYNVGVIDYDWLAGAMGWTGTRGYVAPFPGRTKPAITQGLQMTEEGEDIDPDTVYDERPLFQVAA